jgi:RNA polymerase sigma factor (sigma-70 family)
MLREAEPLTDVGSGLPQRDWPGLVTRIQSGDREAMEELYNILTGGMRYYLYRMLGPQDLDDRLHDCFLAVAKAIRGGQVQQPDRLMGFVRTIVRRQIAGHIASAAECRQREIDLNDTAPQASRGLDPESAAISGQHEQLVATVLKTMFGRDREILNRFYLDEHSQEQICKDMSLTPTQFRLLKSRAKTRFGEFGKRRLSLRSTPVSPN